MSDYRVGVLGATGAVGSTILEVLAERDFPAAEVVPFASERSAGRQLDWNGTAIECRPLSPETIQGLDRDARYVAQHLRRDRTAAEPSPALAVAG